MSNEITRNEKTGRFLVRGRLLWNRLFQPRKNDDGTVGKYECNLAVIKGADLKTLQDEVLAVAKARFPKEFASAGGKWPSGINSPFKKSADSDKLEEIAEAFPVYFAARDKDRPGLVWPNGKKTMLVGDVEREPEPQDVYSGRWVRMAFDVFAYPGAGKAAKNKGVSFGLKAVQLLEDDEELVIGGGRVSAESEFEGVGEAAGSDAGRMFE